jgi:hypothetical protein
MRRRYRTTNRGHSTPHELLGRTADYRQRRITQASEPLGEYVVMVRALEIFGGLVGGCGGTLFLRQRARPAVAGLFFCNLSRHQ